jgi:H+/Cl- antiporter ClcA
LKKLFPHTTPKLLFLAAVAGILAGISSAIFLFLLDIVTHARQQDSRPVILLPVVGFAMGWVYHRYAGRAARGHNLVLDEIHEPKEIVPARMAPFVLGSTLLTHLCGGSAGREGTAVQMGASLADQLGLLTHLKPEERRALLMAGAAAGFGAAIGAPIAGVLFGMEAIRAGRLRLLALAECAVASGVATVTAHLLHAPHSVYPPVEIPPFEWHLPIFAALAGVACGVAARAFVLVEHAVEKALAKTLPYPPLRPLAGGAVIVGLFFCNFAWLRYAGLGIETIQAALRTPASWADPFLKLLFTAITLGSGFKGGEFIPFVFIGATLGSAAAAALGLPLSLFASLGFAAVFGAGSNTPVACAVMAAELFGWGILPYAAIACYCGYLVSGHPGIYKAQRSHGRKHDAIFALAGSLGRRRD